MLHLASIDALRMHVGDLLDLQLGIVDDQGGKPPLSVVPEQRGAFLWSMPVT